MVCTIVSHRVTHDVGAVGCLKNTKSIMPTCIVCISG